MPSPYSQDLRHRVITKLKEGISAQELADSFMIGIATVRRWWKRYKVEGTYEARSGYQNGHSHKISNVDTIKDLLAQNPSMTCLEISMTLGNVSKSTVYNYLKKMKFTRKKSLPIRRAKRRLA